jgi:eukaryotic-like serine/threonine-protein kinase
MGRPDDTPPETFPDELAAIDRALEAGRAPPRPDGPAEDRERLRRAGEFLRRVELLWPRPLPPARAAETAPPSDEKMLGRFRLIRELGRGGFGVVYLAEDPVLNRPVALKVPHPEIALHPWLRRRFLREAQAAAALDHPNIASVFDSGEDGALCYLVTAYCPGGTLADWLKAHPDPCPVADAVGLVEQLADAVQHAHSRGVLHRDLKPANVLLQIADCRLQIEREEGDTPSQSAICNLQSAIPKVTDFGLAKLLDVGEQEGGETRSGALLGTPEYMPPEQAEGRRDLVGPAADVYSLGVILYELLAGGPPFKGLNDLHTLRQVAQDEPIRLSRWRREVPADLEAVCLKCLEKEPAKRYATAGDLADDLRRFRRGEPTRARPVRWWSRAWRRMRRRPAATLVAGVCLAAVLGLVVSSWMYFAHLQEYAASLNRRFEESGTRQMEAEARDVELRRRQYADLVHKAGQFLERGRPDDLVELLRAAPDFAGPSDPRGFEWELLARLERAARPGGPAAVRALVEPGVREAWSVAFSPDGRTLAVGYDDEVGGDKRTLQMWDPATGWLRATLPGHAGTVMCLAYTADGAGLVTGGYDKVLRLWDAAGREVRAFREHAGPVRALAVSANGRLLASTGDDYVVLLWDVASGRQLHALRGHTDKVSGLAFTPDGLTLASAGKDGKVKLWNTATGEDRAALAEEDHVRAAVFSPDGSTLTTGNRGGELRLWDVASGRVVSLLGPPAAVRSVAYSPDGKTVAAGCEDGTVRLWQAVTGQELLTLRGGAKQVNGVAFSPDGRSLAAAVHDGTVVLWKAD